MSSPPHAPPALLPEELVEEFLLRLPPDDPAGLVRAALVCKSWCSVLSSPVFRRRFREFHRARPMLGFFVNVDTSTRFFRAYSTRFVRTCSTCPPIADRRNRTVIHACHGRVLLHVRTKNLDMPLVVWDPITNHCSELPLLPGTSRPVRWNAAVLCAASLDGTCDHLDCHHRHFLVVLIGMRYPKTLAYVYSSDTGAWREPTSVQLPYYRFNSRSTVLAGNALYFSSWNNEEILRYDLGTQEMSLIHPPVTPNCLGCVVTMTMEGGGLGYATVENSTLYLWSWAASRGRDAGWAERRSIELKSLLPADCEQIGCADSTGLLLLHSHVGVLSVDLNSSRVTKVSKESWLDSMFPYLSFYTPAVGASTGEGPRSGIQSA